MSGHHIDAIVAGQQLQITVSVSVSVLGRYGTMFLVLVRGTIQHRSRDGK